MLRSLLLASTPLTALAVLTAPAQAEAPAKSAVVENYVNMAKAGYEDSLGTARTLLGAVETLISSPSEEALKTARAAWKAAREPYQQTEAFRFGNPIVDDWEGKVNAWPLDEGLIDYVDASYGGATDENEYAALDVIANPSFTLGSTEIDASEITPDLIANTLQEAEGIETNVASGYHAIEFLLWGQDLNGTGPGAGERPWTDYAQGEDCTHGNCDRRGQYLKAATELLVSDLKYMVDQWDEDGAARERLVGDEDAAISAILTGIGSLSYGELAGERMKLGLLLHDPEEEHDCFSDNTYNSHYYDALGIENVYLGRYVRTDGSVVEGPSVSDYVAAQDAEADAEMKAALSETMEKMGAMKAAGDGGEAYDQMIAMGNTEGNALVQAAIDGLIGQTKAVERVIAALGAESTIEGSDSLP